MRTQLLTYLTTATASAAVKTSSELPWTTSGDPLYLKNMKYFYLDQEQREQSVMIPTLPGSADILQNLLTVRGYFACDAKNAPTGLTTALNILLAAKDNISVSNFGAEADYTTEIQGDVIVYTIEYRMNTTA